MPHNMHVRNILGFFLNINLHKNLIVFFWRVAHSLKNKFKFQRIHLRERRDLCCQPKMVQSLREMTFKKVLFFVSMDFNYRQPFFSREWAFYFLFFSVKSIVMCLLFLFTIHGAWVLNSTFRNGQSIFVFNLEHLLICKS